MATTAPSSSRTTRWRGRRVVVALEAGVVARRAVAQHPSPQLEDVGDVHLLDRPAVLTAACRLTTRSAMAAASSWSWVTSTAVVCSARRIARQVDGEPVVQLAVEPGERLVEQQHPRARGERAGERDPLGLAAAQVGDRTRIRTRRGRPGRAARRTRAARRRRGTPCMRNPKRDVGRHVRCGEQLLVLEDHADAAPVGRHGGDVDAVDADRAGVGQRQPGDHAQQRALAAPDGPSRATTSPGATASGTSVEHRRATERDGDVVDLERGSARRRSSARSPATIDAASTTAIVAAARIDGERVALGLEQPRRCARAAARWRSASSPARSRQEARRAELAERDRGGEPGGHHERPPQARAGRRPPRPQRRGAERRRRLDRAGVDAAQHAAATVRTTNGTATSAWPTGTSHHDGAPVERRRVERDEHAEPDRHRRRRDRQHQAGVEQPTVPVGGGDRRPRPASRSTTASTRGHGHRLDRRPQRRASGSTPRLIPGRTSVPPRCATPRNE